MADKLKTWWSQSKTWHHVLLGLGMVVFLFLLGIAGSRIVNYGKILPGVSVRGVDVGGLTKEQAIAKLDEKTSQYLSSDVSYTLNGKASTLKPAQLGINFDNREMVNRAFLVGRENDIITDVATQAALPFSKEDIMQLSVDQEAFSNTLIEFNNISARPSQNASYRIDGNKVVIIDGKTGEKIDMGLAILGLTRQLSDLNSSLEMPMNTVSPSRSSTLLNRQLGFVKSITQKPITLTYGGKSWVISQQQILDWLYIENQEKPLKQDLLNRYYNTPTQLSDFRIEKQNVVAFLNGIAGEINQEAVDATLTISGGRATVFKQSQDGRTLNVEKAADSIIAAAKSNSGQPLELAVDVKKAAVSDENIDNLGIKELIGEGVSYFPGSSAARLQNISVGTSRYRGVLLKPGQVFSFGEILGEVGPAQGYAESKVILDGRQEFQYGGGLCQVSSTIFRAALNAGLPILERTNHAFQVSYYTQPFGVPGVDATIYYPAVDFKFKNDTSKHILIEPELVGTTLTFRFYGTKEKEGKIRGPFFNFGSTDVNAPSQTTFYRDVIVNGAVAKTDTFTTYYKSALDFPTSN
jgi:vancomycin resistance protein YoaR